MHAGLIFFLAFMVFALAMGVYGALTQHFDCPHCGTSYKIGVFKYLIGLHFFGQRISRCPNCGEIALVIPKRD